MLSHNVRHYGPEFEQLLLTAAKGLPFKFPLDTVGKAKIMRARIYGYFRALKEENIRLDLIELTEALRITQDDHLIVFLKKHDSWESQAIRQALGLADDFHTHGNADGTELQLPDIASTRFTRRLQEVRDRNDGLSAKIIPKPKN